MAWFNDRLEHSNKNPFFVLPFRKTRHGWMICLLIKNYLVLAFLTTRSIAMMATSMNTTPLKTNVSDSGDYLQAPSSV